MFPARALVALSLLIAAPSSACPSGADYFSFGEGSSAPIPRLREHGGRATAAIGVSPDFVLMGVDGDLRQAWGARVEARAQRRELALVIDAGLYEVVHGGSLARAGAALRWEPIAWRMDASAAVAPFLELGAGIERWDFADGSPRRRPDANIGLGLHVHGGANDSRSTRHIGVTIVTRLLVAEGAVATDVASRTTTAPRSESRTEVGLEVGLAVTFGRRGHP